jgi:hypothetical protein
MEKQIARLTEELADVRKLLATATEEKELTFFSLNLAWLKVSQSQTTSFSRISQNSQGLNDFNNPFNSYHTVTLF